MASFERLEDTLAYEDKCEGSGPGFASVPSPCAHPWAWSVSMSLSPSWAPHWDTLLETWPAHSLPQMQTKGPF